MTDDKGRINKSDFSAEIGDSELDAVLGDFKASMRAWSDDAYSRSRTLDAVLSDFKASVHAWSAAAYCRPRTLAATTRQWNWRLATGWAMGSLVLAVGLTGGLHQRQVHREQARIVAAQHAKQVQLAAEQKSVASASSFGPDADQDSDLLAAVDTDVSREVPSAMEPLAQLMDDDSPQ